MIPAVARLVSLSLLLGVGLAACVGVSQTPYVDPSAPVAPGSQTLTRCPGMAVPASDGSDPLPSVVCSPPSGSFFPRGTTLVTCTATDAAGNQATCEFPVTVRTRANRR